MKTPRSLRTPRAEWWLLAALLVLLAFAASGNSIGNGFTYDDVFIVQKNGSTHSLAHFWRFFAQSYWPKSWGGDGYRPLTILAFAIEWTVGGGAPWVFHLVNVLLYAASVVALFWLASALLPRAAAWIAAAIFAVHPVHVEAVANVVGQAELSVALLLFVAVGLYLHRRAAAAPDRFLDRRTIAVIAVLYAVALYAKEHAIVLPALLVAAELVVIEDRRPWKERLLASRPMLAWLTLVAVAYLGTRSLAKHGEITGFQPFIVFQALGLSYTNRVLTMLGVVPEWLRLMLWPAHLRTEYAPPYIDIAQGPSLQQLPGTMMLFGILGLFLALWYRRRGVAAAFGIAWFCIALLPSSNFVIPAGIILAERTLFLPSAGMALCAGAVAAWLARTILAARSHDAARNASLAAIAVGVLILVAGIGRSITRNRVWHDNDRLFREAVVDAPDSYRAHYMLGAWEFENKRLKAGEREMRHALQLFPYDPFLAYNFAQQYDTYGMCNAAVPLYRWSFRIAPDFMRGVGRARLALCLIETGNPEEGRRQILIGMRMGGAPLRDFRDVLRAADSVIAVTRTRGAATSSDSTGHRNLPRVSQNTRARPGQDGRALLASR